MTRLSEKQMDAVRRAMRPLDHLQQDAFIASLNNLLEGYTTIGDGELYQMLRDLQREHMRAYPNLNGVRRM